MKAAGSITVASAGLPLLLGGGLVVPGWAAAASLQVVVSQLEGPRARIRYAR